MTAILEQLAAHANVALPAGINWAEQDQAYGTPAGSVEAFRADPDGKAGYIAELYMARSAVVLSLGKLGINARDNLDIFAASRDQDAADILAAQSQLQVALVTGQASLAAPVMFNLEAIRDYLATYTAMLQSELETHASKLVFEMGYSTAEIAARADSLVRAYHQLRHLLDSGALEPLAVRARTLVGITYAGGVLLGIGVLLLVAIIAGAIVYGQYLSQSIAAAKEACLKLVESGNPAAGGMCGKLVPKPLVEPINVNQAGNSLLFYAMVGGVVLGGLYLFANRKGGK